MNTNDVLLQLLVAIARPDLETDGVFEIDGIVYAADPEDRDGATTVGYVSELIDKARKLAQEVKKLRKDFNSEANYQDWRAGYRREEE